MEGARATACWLNLLDVRRGGGAKKKPGLYESTRLNKPQKAWGGEAIVVVSSQSCIGMPQLVSISDA